MAVFLGYRFLLARRLCPLGLLLLGACMPARPTIPQIKEIVCTDEEFGQALKNVSINLKYETTKDNDTLYHLTQEQFNAFDKNKSIKLFVQRRNDTLKLTAKGIVLNEDGYKAGPANVFACYLNSAIEQEIGFFHGEPVYGRRMPEKSSPIYWSLSMLCPGFGAYYMLTNPMVKKRGAVFIAIGLTVLDAGYIYMYADPLVYQDPYDPTKTKNSKGLGLLGIITFRAFMVMSYFTDFKYYQRLQRTPYYFKIDEVNDKAAVGYEFNF